MSVRTLRRTTTVARPIDEVWVRTNDPRMLAQVFAGVEGIDVFDAVRSEWRLQTDEAERLSWLVAVERRDTLREIVWRTLEGSEVHHHGSVRLARAAGGNGTVLLVEVTYDSSRGPAGRLLDKLFGDDPEQLVREALLRFRRSAEEVDAVPPSAAADGGAALEEPDLVGAAPGGGSSRA